MTNPTLTFTTERLSTDRESFSLAYKRFKVAGSVSGRQFARCDMRSAARKVARKYGIVQRGAIKDADQVKVCERTR